MTKFRPQRGGLAESMAETIEFASLDALRSYLQETLPVWVEAVEVKPYGFDARIGWDTYIVTVNGMAVGFTDGPFPDAPPQSTDP
jgi:hypothetical protein